MDIWKGVNNVLRSIIKKLKNNLLHQENYTMKIIRYKLIITRIIELKNRRDSDVMYALIDNLRSNIGCFIKNKSFNKNSPTKEILGCTLEEFKQHIQSQFLNWMSWENYGNICEKLTFNCSWDLDHIIPISQAKTIEDIHILNHWSNFQPLCSKVNREIKKNSVYSVTNLELGITKIE